jgi:outer membrane cobalamin receptor
MAMILMNSSLIEKERAVKYRQGPIWKAAIGFWVCILILAFSVSSGFADEEEEAEEKTVLEDMIVIGAPYKNPAAPVTTRYGTQYNLVTEEQIKEQNAYDFQNALRDVPGVMFQSKNLVGSQTSHSLYIRGRGASHPSPDFAILFDGVPRYGALFGQVLGDSIAMATIGGMEVYKSPQPSQFGSGYALINVLPKYLKEEGQELAFDFSGGSYATLDQSLAGGIKKGPYDLYVSQSWAATDGHRDHSAAEQQNYYANAGYEINDMWNIRLLANYVKSQTEAPMPDPEPTATNGVSWPMAERFDTETTLTTLTLNNQFAQAAGYLKGYWNDTNFDLVQELSNGQRYGNGSGGLRSRQKISLRGLRAREKFQLWSGGEIIAGADLDLTELQNTQQTYSGLAVPGINGGQATRVWDFPDTRLLSPYLAVSQYIGHGDGFHFIPSAGWRYFDHNEFKDGSAGQAGLVAGYGQTNLNINYSQGINYPSPVVLMNFVREGAPVAGAEQYWKEIKPEVVDHYEVGLTHTWPERASVGATAFHDKGKDRFRAYMYGPIPAQFNDPIGHYEINGLELTGTVTPVQALELFAGATWLEAEVTGSDNIEQDHMPYTPGFQFQAGATWAFLDRFRLFLDMQHLRGLYQGTNFRTSGFDFNALDNSDKLDDITLVNARLSYGFDYRPWRLSEGELFLAVNNIFDEDYEYAKGYEMPGTTFFAGTSLKF